MATTMPTDGQTILLVDDEEHLRVTLRDFLAFSGYTVLLARSGEQALKVLETQTPDLIILDISMPGMGGMGFLQRVAHTEIKVPPILVLTARTNLQQFFDGLDVAGFISKPCKKDVLIAEVRRILHTSNPVEPKASKMTKVRVLLGEDDPEMSGVIERAFTRHGHSVTVADTGPAVLDSAPQEMPDVVVIKQYLTRLNGKAVATLLRAMPSTRSIPIVLYHMIGIGDPVSDIAVDTTHINDFIEAHDSTDILDAVERVMDVKA
ncbi:MAG: response regulator [Lentisphaerae bacterium]|nr:response regulator [Lentisphaerota bacterium]